MQPCARLSTMITETLASKIQRHIDLIPSERRVKPLRTELMNLQERSVAHSRVQLN